MICDCQQCDCVIHMLIKRTRGDLLNNAAKQQPTPADIKLTVTICFAAASAELMWKAALWHVIFPGESIIAVQLLGHMNEYTERCILAETPEIAISEQSAAITKQTESKQELHNLWKVYLYASPRFGEKLYLYVCACVSVLAEEKWIEHWRRREELQLQALDQPDRINGVN